MIALVSMEKQFAGGKQFCVSFTSPSFNLGDIRRFAAKDKEEAENELENMGFTIIKWELK